MSHHAAASTPSQVWASLRPTLLSLLRDPDAGLSSAQYMSTYTAVYNHCTSKPDTTAQYSAGANVYGSDLYFHLRDLVHEHLNVLTKQAAGLIDIDLLAFYMREWNKFSQTAKFLDHLFSYINRHWVKRAVDDHRSGVYRIHTMVLVTWKQRFFDAISDSLIKSILDQIKLERDGEQIDRSMLKSVIDSLVALDMPNNEAAGANAAQPERVYRTVFENPFFSATSLYYKAESERFLAENSVIEYMKKVEARLQEEADRVVKYLDASTLAPLTTLCEDRLIADHQEAFKDEFQSLLDHDKVEDLARMFVLLQRRANTLDPLRTKLELHVRKVGQDHVTQIAAAGESAAGNAAGAGDDDEGAGGAGGAAGAGVDAKVYVNTLLQVQKKYADLVNVAFKNDTGFVASLDKACREFVNRNAVCKTSTAKSPELLAKYSDMLLKKSAKNPEEAELDEALNQIMTVFKYIEDKDVFQKFYAKALAKRLVNQTSASEDAESLMITKLKDACGYDYTSKLQRLFTDVGTSKDLNEAFRKQVADLGLDFSIIVMSTGVWPFQVPASAFELPEELLPTYNRFMGFYTAKHSGRKLTWLHNQSKGEVRAQWATGNKLQYAFQVHVYQMGILLQYNNATSYTWEELLALTKLDAPTLAGHLGTFLKAKIMIQEPEGAPVGDAGTKYALNMSYKNRKVRMNLNVPIKAEQKAEADEAHKTIEEDRKLLIQAAIVRIMKTRKVMKHQALVQETVTQLSARFKPKVSDIKKCIEILLEKEYLERVDGEKDTFSYVA
ncbi:hypothetical protein GGF32_009611 [Allomyces javanicus]|nr:hypothetical protein GGF32_009611 [Allomyces javanicus]